MSLPPDFAWAKPTPSASRGRNLTSWGSMAVAIMGGLIVATALMLLALPAMCAAWFRVNRASAATG